PSLVIAPATLLENWRRELSRFAPGLSVLVHRGSTRTGFPDDLRTAHTVVTSYETAVRDQYLLGMVNWNIVVLDEAQAIKNPESERSRVVRAIPRRIGLAVTGTPVENRLTDLWSIMDFAIPGLLGTRDEFERTYPDDTRGAARLEPIVSPVMLRRRVSEVAGDLPERIDMTQYLELDEATAERYDRLREQAIGEYGDHATFRSLVRLRQLCTHPRIIEGDVEPGDLASESVKYRRLLEILEEISEQGEKAIIFTSFTRMIDLLVRDLSRRLGILTDCIDGRTPQEDRQPRLDRFASHAGPGVLVLNPRAAGTGLNITAANHVIHYNPEWNPALEDQASARAYRRGQTRPVTVHRLIYARTVEEIMDQRLKRKRELADNAVVGTDAREADLLDVMAALRVSPV
ncbi:MAG: DEAD/DEAH box helicase, partial [Gammaproteobacteria bacterium]